MQPGWEFHSEMRSLPGTAIHENTSAVLLNNPISHSQPQARSFADGFGREKGIEDPSDILFGNAHAGIGDIHDNHGFIHSRLNCNLSAGGHGIPRIQEQVDENLLKLARVSDKPAGATFVSGFHLDVVDLQADD